MCLKTVKRLLIMTMLLILAGCEQAQEAGDDAARELTGSNMLQQKKAVERQLQSIEHHQADRLKEIE